MKTEQVDTEKLARDFLASTRTAVTEEDVKMKVEPVLQRAFRQIGVDVNIVAYEKATAVTAKRMDAVYGYLIIEYKAPGKLATAKNIQDVKDQLQFYLEEESRRHSDPSSFLEKAIGVAMDESRILFARFSRTTRILSMPVPIETETDDLFPEIVPQCGFQFHGPYPVNASSLANLLVYVRSAGRRPLTAADLATVFGPGHETARVLVSELYACTMRGQRKSKYPRVATFYAEWDRIFGVVYGEKLDKAEKAAAETASLYNLPSGIHLKHLLFAIHTFYAFLMKLIAIELLALQRDANVSTFVGGVAALNDPEIRKKLIELEGGAGFTDRGITNFLEADFFSWYLDVWTGRLATGMRGVVRALADFEPATPVLEPEWTRDLLQKLYELLVPKMLRHGLGEYYTPDWLAGHLVDKTGYDGTPRVRFLDPACGSGTFLVQAIHRAARCAEKQNKVRIAEVGRAILDSIMGFDLNPLAVLAARTNYLIAFARFLPYVRPISIPVYLCDSVLPPDRRPEERQQRELFDADTVVFHTQEHDYVFPVSMKNKERIDLFTSQVMVGLRGKMTPEQFHRMFVAKCSLPVDEMTRLVEIYAKIKKLDDEKRDGIWAHYIKNAFAPNYVGQFDYVVGNPPWIRWGYLADEYRKLTLNLWQNYGLFSLAGHESRLGAGEKDFSMLFTYACADRYLKDGGTLGFVITHEVFKSKGAGEGFRRFQLGETGAKMKITAMEDMVHLLPFQAANKTCVFTLKKGKATTYPVPVVEWRRKNGIGCIEPEWPLEEVLKKTDRTKMQAIPVDGERDVSSWQTAPAGQVLASARFKGANAYVARLGARVEPYGVFWLNLKEVRPDGQLVVENQFDRGKRKIDKVCVTIEPELVFPAVSGGEIVRFGVKKPFYVLVSQDQKTRMGYDEDWMLSNVPLSYAYLTQFKKILMSRAAYQKYFYREIRKHGEVVGREPIAPFYSMYNISRETFAKYRVAWKRMASKMGAVVLDGWKTPFGTKTLIATDTVSLITADNAREAHYLCAILNSSALDGFIRSFSSGGRGFGAPSVMKNIAIPRFDPAAPLHASLAELSVQAHAAVKRGEETTAFDSQIDEQVEELWNTKR
jgi:hypothetical protein